MAKEGEWLQRCEQQLLLPPSAISSTSLLPHSLLSPTLCQPPHGEGAAKLDDGATPTVLLCLLLLHRQSWLLCLSSAPDDTKDKHRVYPRQSWNTTQQLQQDARHTQVRRSSLVTNVSAFRSSSSSSSCSSSLPPIPQYLTLPSRGSAFHKPGPGQTKTRELEQYANQWQGRQGSAVMILPKTDTCHQVILIQIYLISYKWACRTRGAQGTGAFQGLQEKKQG